MSETTTKSRRKSAIRIAAELAADDVVARLSTLPNLKQHRTKDQFLGAFHCALQDKLVEMYRQLFENDAANGLTLPEEK
jgi:hypothetical protein